MVIVEIFHYHKVSDPLRRSNYDYFIGKLKWLLFQDKGENLSVSQNIYEPHIIDGKNKFVKPLIVFSLRCDGREAHQLFFLFTDGKYTDLFGKRDRKERKKESFICIDSVIIPGVTGYKI